MTELSELSDSDLRELEEQRHFQIYSKYACYSTGDVREYQRICEELSSREIDIPEKDYETWVEGDG